jgi:hypothetical protein
VNKRGQLEDAFKRGGEIRRKTYGGHGLSLGRVGRNGSKVPGFGFALVIT